MQNLQKSIRTNAELTKVHSDKRQLENSDKRQLNNSDKCSFPKFTFFSKFQKIIFRNCLSHCNYTFVLNYWASICIIQIPFIYTPRLFKPPALIRGNTVYQIELTSDMENIIINLIHVHI